MFNRETYTELTKAMKSADTTAENKATPWAKATFEALLAKNADGEHEFTIDSMVAALVAVYKPKTASGKPAKTLGSLPAMPRQRANAIAFAMKNIGVPGVREAVVDFIADDKAKLAGLQTVIRECLKANTVKEEDIETEEGEGEGEDAILAAATVPAINEMLANMAAYVNSLNPDECDINADDLLNLLEAVTGAVNRIPVAPMAMAA